MDIWIVEGGQLTLYKRTGQCNRCGECCMYPASYSMSWSPTWPPSNIGGKEIDEDWSDFEGWSSLYAQGIWWWFKAIENEYQLTPCSGFDADTRQCARWQNMDDFRPMCRYWPVHPKDIDPFMLCGFSFERVGY